MILNGESCVWTSRTTASCGLRDSASSCPARGPSFSVRLSLRPCRALSQGLTNSPGQTPGPWSPPSCSSVVWQEPGASVRMPSAAKHHFTILHYGILKGHKTGMFLYDALRCVLSRKTENFPRGNTKVRGDLRDAEPVDERKFPFARGARLVLG